MRPCSTSIITLVVVATTLVSDARSKMVSSVIGSTDGVTRAIADGLLIEDSIASADEDNRARQLLVGNRLAYEWLDRIEPAHVYWSLLLRDTGARAGRHRGHDSKMRSLLFRGHLSERQDQNGRCEAEGHGR